MCQLGGPWTQLGGSPSELGVMHQNVSFTMTPSILSLPYFVFSIMSLNTNVPTKMSLFVLKQLRETVLKRHFRITNHGWKVRINGGKVNHESQVEREAKQ